MSEAECDKLEAEEEEEDKKRRNVLMDLQTCFDEVSAMRAIQTLCVQVKVYVYTQVLIYTAE